MPESTTATSTAPATMRTSIGHSTTDDIWVQGYHLPDELMGVIDFGSMFFLLITQRLPDEGEARLFNSILVALADHGLTPTALAARLTYTGAPEAIQGSIAAGVLGAGSVFLGVFEDAGRVLKEAGPTVDDDEARLQELADTVIAEHRAAKRFLPGLGHPIHKNGDPRVVRLRQIAEEAGLLGPHTRLMLTLQERAAATARVPLPLNAAGLCGALLADLGMDPSIMRGVAVVSRAAGVVGHLAEEIRQPMGRALWDLAEEQTTYEPLR